MCFPGFADPAIFASLLGSGGLYRVLVEERSVSGGYYDEGTLIWHQRWVRASGVVESVEALAYPAVAGRAVLLRRLEATRAPAPITVLLELGPDYGRASSAPWKRSRGAFVTEGPGFFARLSGGPEATVVRGTGGRRLGLRTVLKPGERRDLVLELDVQPLDPFPPAASDLWRATEQTWRGEVPAMSGFVARSDARRSYAVLRGMTSASGGTVAAATTSLPEHRDNGRNYDYRYAWIRDTCYIGHAGAATPDGEAMLDDAVRFVAARLNEDGVRTLPAYRVDGRPIPPPIPLHLPGYPGGRDVAGNRVNEQFQYDLFGEALLLFARAAAVDRLDEDARSAVRVAIATIEQRAHDAESGIWEIEPRLWTHSRLIATAGLRAIAEQSDQQLAVRALTTAECLLDETTRAALHPSGRWRRAPDDERTDAALLLAGIRRAVRPLDPRSVATRAAVRSELSEDEYVYRFAQGGATLGEAEGAFLVCNFWMALAALDAEDREDAVRWFERARTSCGSPGLFSEEFDVEERQLRGNLPQAFVHALLIETAARLGQPEWPKTKPAQRPD